MEMPGFWDKPTASAGLMQKRRQIERKVENLRSLRSDADEIATWQELLGSSGDADPDALAFVERLERRGRRARPAVEARRPRRRQERPDVDQRRRRRHRVAGLGRDAAAHVRCAGPEKRGFDGRAARPAGRRGGGHQERDARRARRLRLRLPQGRDAACTGWCGSARSTRSARRHTSFAAVDVIAGDRRRHRDRDRRRGPARSTPIAPAAPAASTSTRPTRPCASRTCRPASSCSARTSAPAQEPRTGDEDAAGPALRAASSRSARQKMDAVATATRARSPGATRSAPTCCSPTAWSRTTAPATRPATPTACSTATSTRFIEAWLKGRIASPGGDNEADDAV